MKEDHKFYEMLQEYVREDVTRHESEKKAKGKLKIFMLTAGITATVLFLSWIVYLLYTVRAAEESVSKRDLELVELRQDLQTALYEQYFYEEEAEKYKDLLVKNYPEQEIDISETVKNNLEKLKTVTKGFTGKNIDRGNENFREIALTFDLASGEDLDDIYQYIKKYDIRVTIFLSNETPHDKSGSLFSRTNISYIKKMHKMGKVEFGNHTWSHYNHYRSLMEKNYKKRKMLTAVSDEILDIPLMEMELDRVNERFREITGAELTKMYRLPYGSLNNLILNSYASIGYDSHIMWSHNSFGSLDIPDYILKKYVYKKSDNNEVRLVKNPFYKTKDEVLEFLDKWEQADPNGMNGAIILMHLGTPRKHDKLIEVLPEFIEKMQNKGYDFVTVSEVLNSQAD